MDNEKYREELVVDLRGRTRSDQADLYRQVHELPYGSVIQLVLDENPQILLESLRLHVHGRIAWEFLEEGDPDWRVRIAPRTDYAPRTVGTLLSRDHERLDALLSKALEAANADDGDTLREAFPPFAQGIRRHIQVEDELLVPVLGAKSGPPDGPIETMQREHQDILAQVELIESQLEDAPASEIATYLGLLSGTLAKHESREENHIFPAWDIALSRAGTGAEKRMVADAQAILDAH